MRLRRFEAATVAEALARVRADLGPDAVILHARVPEAAPEQQDRSRRVEVTAAVDDEPNAGCRVPGAKSYDTTIRQSGTRESARVPECQSAAAAPRAARSVPQSTGPRVESSIGPFPVDQLTNGQIDARSAEADRMEEMYRMLLELRDGATPTPRMPVALRPLYRELCRREVPGAVARRLLSSLPARLRSGRSGAVQAALRSAFRVQGLPPAGGKRRVVVLVGPTGVGKTTTIAKLAGQCRQAESLRVALVSLDTYRIGAMAQMQIYAELLGTPFYSVRSRADLAQALRTEAAADLVLVDSMGRSPQHREGIAALGAWLADIPDPEVHLVVSATTKGSDLDEVMRRFRPLRCQHLLITKLDEARSAGSVLGMALQHDLSISYLATGQEVPDDLEPATPGRLASFLYPGRPGNRARAMARA